MNKVSYPVLYIYLSYDSYNFLGSRTKDISKRPPSLSELTPYKI